MAKAQDKTEESVEGGTVASVERALAVLDAFETGDASLSLAELAARTGLYKSTILRLADTLARRGYLVRSGEGSYEIGPKPFLLGARYQSAVIPAEWILPVLRRLVSTTGESASYNVRHGDFRVCLWRVDSPHLIRDHTQPGDVRPLGQGAAGSLLLAFSRLDDKRHESLRQGMLSRSYGEIEPEMGGIGAPVFGADGLIRGVLTLSGPRSRFTPESIAVMELTLLRAAQELTQRVGGSAAAFAVAIERLRADGGTGTEPARPAPSRTGRTSRNPSKPGSGADT